jgi:hypothetical protein
MLTGELGSGLQRIWKHLWTLLAFLSAPLLNRLIVRQGMAPPRFMYFFCAVANTQSDLGSNPLLSSVFIGRGGDKDFQR